LERDTESGLDHAWFRQYGSSFGRWLSPDPLGGDITNPQSLNRYAYVRNIPATLTDPSGLCGSGSLTYGCGLGQVAIGKGLAQFGTGSGLTSGPTCTVDGEPWPCGFAEELVQAGAAALCPGDICHGVATDTAGNNRIVQYWAFG